MQPEAFSGPVLIVSVNSEDFHGGAAITVETVICLALRWEVVELLHT